VVQPQAAQCQLAEQRAEQDRMVAFLRSRPAAARTVDSFCRVIANLMLGHRPLHTLQDFFGLRKVQPQFLRR